MKRKLLLLIIMLSLGYVGWGQTLLLSENFDYTIGTDLTANGWNITGTTATPTVAVSASSITYSGYLSSSIGNEVSLATSGQDVNKTFTAQTTGIVYASCLVNITSASTTGDYFFHLGASSIGTTYHGRVFVKRDASNNLAFGISRAGAVGTAVFTPYSYALNTTYLLVLRYSIVSGASNDLAAIYINPALNAVEPGTGWTSSTDTPADLANIGSVALRQGSASSAPALKLDGIRVATTWADIVGAVSFSAPTTQAYNIVFANIQQTQMDASWTNGNGSKRIVKISTSNSFTDPTDGSDPTANAAYGGSGEQVVFNNSGSSLTITGLTAGTTYYYRVYEYNGTGSGTKYYTATATNNPNSQATSSASTPTITLTGSLSAFAATLIGSTSAEQSYTVSGSNLTADITITPPSGFEISTGTGESFVSTNPITLSPVDGSVSATTIYVRFAPSAAQSYSGNITHASTDAATQNQAVSGMGIKSEPSNYATSFEATTGSPSYSAAMVDWTDATGDVLPDGYLIKGSTTSYDAITTPVDGTAETDGGLVKNIAQGTGIYEFTGLNANTTYYFKIFSYTNTGNNINYKTDGTIPQSSVTTDTQPVNTYTWNVASGNWNTATSWTPSRTSPLANDILIFDGSVQAAPSVTIDFTSPQTIGRLRIINNAAVTFATSDATRTLNIGYAGSTSPQLEVASGSSLTVSAANALTLNVLTGFTGSISGSITYQNAAHKLTATDASGITFNSGSLLILGTGFSSNIFGTTSLNSVVFANGSSLIQQAGSNPFGATQPSSVVVFQTGSLFKIIANLSPAFSGRTYANLEIDATGVTLTTIGGAAVAMDNLTITNGTLNFNMTATPGHSIKGNITVAAGATLNFNPASAGTINLNGSNLQTISGAGTISAGSLSTIAVANSTGVILNTSATLNNLTVSSGTFTINSGKSLTISGILTNNGTLTLQSPGDNGAPGSLITNGTVSGNVIAERYIAAYTTATDGWHLVSSPVNGALIGNFSPGTNDDFYKYNETENLWKNWKVSSFDFTNGEGYLCSYQSAATKSFTGVPNNADVSFSDMSFTSTRGWHLLGNPFPCAIKWNDGNWTLININTTAKVLNSGGSYTDITANGIIPAMQGFFVEVTNSTNSITIPKAARVHDATAWYKDVQANRLVLTAQSDNNNTYTETVVRFDPEATTGFDEMFDSHFLSGIYGAPQFYSIVGNEKLSSNVFPVSGEASTIPLGFVKGNADSYTLSASGIETFANGQSVILEDLKTGIQQKLNDNPVYSFTSATGDDVNRFQLKFGAASGINEPFASPFIIYVSNGIVYVNNSDNQTLKGIVTVYSVTGQAITTRSLTGDRLQKLSFNGKPGCYIVRVTTDKGVYSQKIIL